MNAIYDPIETKDVPAVADKTSSPPAKTNASARAKVAPIFVEAEKMFDKMAEITKETAARAFDFFRDRGGEWGRELDDWFRAESEILMPVPIEIKQTDETIYVTAAVPGFKPDEIEVSVKDNFLILSGTAKSRETKTEDNVVLSEWKSNRFLRQLYLPANVIADKVEAKLADGILELTLPKAAEHETKKISVAAG
jgi:HSP20 family protein